MELWGAVRAEHGRNGFAAGFCHRDAWHALDDAWLFHERWVELRGDAADDSAIVAGEAGVGWGGGCGAPEMIGGVGEEVNFGLVEER